MYAKVTVEFPSAGGVPNEIRRGGLRNAAVICFRTSVKRLNDCRPICLIGPYNMLTYSVRLTELHMALRRSGILPDHFGL